MTVDLAQLRRLAEECQRMLPNGTASVVSDEEHAAFYRWVTASSPVVVLELLDRLERAQRKLDLFGERLRAYAGREELLAILSTGEPVYPGLMSKVGKEGA
jgi:hypothetical protein